MYIKIVDNTATPFSTALIIPPWTIKKEEESNSTKQRTISGLLVISKLIKQNHSTQKHAVFQAVGDFLPHSSSSLNPLSGD